MNRDRFSKDEAERLVGTRVRTRPDLTDLPEGTPGQVAGWEEAGREGKYDVIVRFDPVLTSRPVIKVLSKSGHRSNPGFAGQEMASHFHTNLSLPQPSANRPASASD